MPTLVSMLCRGVRLAGLPVLLSACAVTPPEHPPPAVPLPAQFAAAPVDAGPAAERWWEAFGDAQLDAFVENALVRNPGIGQAIAELVIDLGGNVVAVDLNPDTLKSAMAELPAARVPQVAGSAPDAALPASAAEEAVTRLGGSGTAAGRAWRKRAARAGMASVTSKTLLPGWARIMASTAGLAFRQPALRSLCGPLCTRATLSSRTGRPSR